ncbi:MAG TPA: transposase [Candidatus Paceibacterota bacterium]|nr:transposase [Candidatus Paceibacterota bacterium]
MVVHNLLQAGRLLRRAPQLGAYSHRSAGIYCLSCAKENMKLGVIGVEPFDPQAPVNQGVLADELVSTSQGVMVRPVTYRDPVGGEIFGFLTNELTLPPGIIAHLYRLRWDIEKVFDEFKNKLAEKKAWATGATAKTIQAQLLCLMHNLLRLFDAAVLVALEVQNAAEDRRRQKRLGQVKAQLQDKGQKLPWLVEALQRCTQCSVEFIRWLRSFFFSTTSCSQALEVLRALYAKL